MKKILLLLPLSICLSVQAQCTIPPSTPIGGCATGWNPDAGLNISAYTFPNQPNNETYKEMIGINGSTWWDNFYLTGTSTNTIPQIASFVRDFHLIEKDYQLNKPCPAGDCSPYSMCVDRGGHYQCTPAQREAVTGIPYNGIDLYRYRYSQWKPDIKNIQVTLNIGPTGDLSFDTPHGYPANWWTQAEWGGGTDPQNPNIAAIYDNAYKYVQDFAATFCPDSANCLVKVLEVGNEPWGYQIPATYDAIARGLVDGLSCYYGSSNPNNWRMKLLPGAMQAFHAEDNNPFSVMNPKNYMGTRVSCNLMPYYDGLNLHPYAFQKGTFNLVETPESANGEFEGIKNAIKWRDINAPGKRIYVTEYGWDTETVGTAAQCAYILRGAFEMARLGVHRATVYHSNDETFTGLFGSCGVFTVNGSYQPTGQKQQFFALKEVRDNIGDKRFLEYVREDNVARAHLLANDNSGTPTHLLVWRPVPIAQNGSNSHAMQPVTITLPYVMTFNQAGAIWLEGLNIPYTGTITQAGMTVTVDASPTPLLIPITSVLGNEQLSLNADAHTNGEVVLSWNSSELAQNPSQFIVEKSHNGSDFTPISTQQAENIDQYHYVDYSRKHNAWYRIKAIFADGTSLYSNVENILFVGNEISISPNPSENIAHLHQTQNEKLSVKIFNITGALIHSFETEAEEYALPELSTGIYSVEIQTENESYHLKWVHK